MKHKLRIHSMRWRFREPRVMLWYVYCQAKGCKWEVPRLTWPDGAERFGRPSLDDALAIGALHQLRHLNPRERERVGTCPPCDDYDELNGLNG